MTTTQPAAPPARFTCTPSHPLAAEHARLGQVLDAMPPRDWSYREPLSPDAAALGREIAALAPDAVARYARALVERLAHDDRASRHARAQLENDTLRMNWHLSPAWKSIWPRRMTAWELLKPILRRKLPLGDDGLTELATWIADGDSVHDVLYPAKTVARLIQTRAAAPPLPEPLRAATARLADTLRNRGDGKHLRLLGEQLEKLTDSAVPTGAPGDGTARPESAQALPDAAIPAPVGSPRVLVRLKQHLGLPLAPDDVPTETVGLDRFPLRADSPLRAEHALITDFLPGVVERTGYHDPNLDLLGVPVDEDPRLRGRLMLAAAERFVATLLERADQSDHRVWQSRYAVTGMFRRLACGRCEFDRDALFDALLVVSAVRDLNWIVDGPYLAQIAAYGAGGPLSPGERHVLHRLRANLVGAPPLGQPNARAEQLTGLIGDRPLLALVPGEAWSDAANADLARLPAPGQRAWLALLGHALTATAARPSPKWLKAADGLLSAVGPDRFAASVAAWLARVNSPRTVPLLCDNLHDTGDANGRMNDHNATVLRGLAWIAPRAADTALTRALGALAASAYRKIRGVGPRAVKVGNAAVYALSEIGDEAAVGQLAVLRVKVRFGTAQKEIDKAYTAAAHRLDVPRDQIEEMGVPSYGLDDVGLRRETLGDHRVELVVTGVDAELKWFDAASGKPLKSVPARVKKEHKDELKDLQQSLKDIAAMLPAQRDRVDALFLAAKTWPLAAWRDRYLDHPLVGTIARRLIWRVDDVPALFVDGRLLDVTGRPVPHADTSAVRLWHPIDAAGADEVTAWRRRLEDLRITQPFKQAHREIYLLTDAERRTRTYSNRFAAHVIRQHQFNALCAARGWRNKLRLMVDDTYPPASRALPQHGLRAEFWVEGVGEDYGADTTESGAFRHLSTDQVRFYPLNAPENSTHAFGGGYTQHGTEDAGTAPLPLDQIPPLVLSEIFRDVDLFVGVASVGNDPTWQDGGPGQRYRQYWQSYSFGDLTESARTRRAVLETLLPRLKIKDRARLADRFLVVTGKLRTYKIHLGSGNILMEPNDQYLCIVPDQSRRSAAADPGLFLPFEGDNTLALILSKAFLLAADDRITDPTITRQIKSP